MIKFISLRFLCYAILFFSLVGGLSAATLSERTYKKLTVIHELIGDNKYKEAISKLDALLPRVKKKQYEYANVMQTYGFAYAATSRYKKAIQAFNKALDTNALPDQVQHTMRYNLSQLYAGDSDYKSAVRTYEQWFANAEKPSPDSYIFGATLYAQLKQYKKAIAKATKAISLAKKPRESWYQLLLSMHYEEKHYSKASGVLESMVAIWPDKKKYWKQLSGVYFALKKNRKSLAVLELANKRGFLDDSKELINLVNLYLLEDIPYKAAKLLTKEMAAGRVPETGENLQKLGEAWMRAKESDNALSELGKAAEKKNKGKLFLRMAQLYSEKEDWGNVIKFSDKALSMGDLTKPGGAHLLRGMAYYELGKKKRALAAFVKASKYNSSKKQAQQWVNHLSNSA